MASSRSRLEKAFQIVPATTSQSTAEIASCPSTAEMTSSQNATETSSPNAPAMCTYSPIDLETVSPQNSVLMNSYPYEFTMPTLPNKVVNNKKTLLTLDEKLELINAFESKTSTIKQIQERFNCGKTQIYETIKRKNELLQMRSYTHGSMRRKSRTCANEDVNHLVLGWVKQAKAQKIPINGPLIQAQAKVIAERLGNKDFKASNGWLNSFRHRYNIVLRKGKNKNLQDEDDSESVYERIYNQADARYGGQEMEDYSGAMKSHDVQVSGTDEKEKATEHNFTYYPDPYMFLDKNHQREEDDDSGETDDQILQQLPNLGRVKQEPLDPDNTSAVDSSTSASTSTAPASILPDIPVSASPSSILPDVPTPRNTTSPSSTILTDYLSRKSPSSILPDSPSSSRSSTNIPPHTISIAFDNATDSGHISSTPAAKRRKATGGPGKNPEIDKIPSFASDRDEFAVFGEFVAAKLRNFKDRRNQLLAQNAITGILIEMEMKDMDEASIPMASS